MGKLVNNVKIPPFSSGSGKDAVLGHIQNCPWASSYALRPSGSFGYALGRHLFQNPSEKGGISAHNAILAYLEASICAAFGMLGFRLGPLPPPPPPPLPPPAPNPLTLGSFLTRFSAPLESVLIGVRVAAE